MKKLFSLLIVLYLIQIDARIVSQDRNPAINSPQELKIMFYNVENLFDIYDDSTTLDNEFLPDRGYYWTYKKLQKKLTNIYKVVMAAGEWHVPDLIGLAEIENRYVLRKLVDDTPLSKFNYNIVHENSPDIRGIDVALLYRPDNFTVIKHSYHRISFEQYPDVKTRDILHVEGIAGADTFHVFINHWPSRRGGAAASEPKRVHVASKLKALVDSLQRRYTNPNIVITGDFNDDPDNASIQKVLSASLLPDDTNDPGLYNLSVIPCREKLGTLKYRDSWNCFDQMIVSGSLLDNEGWDVSSEGMYIFNNDMVLTDDERYGGKKPYRTYIGRKYQGGFSDHLPVLVTLIK